MKVIESAGPGGVSLALLRKVMPDTEALAVARAIHKDRIREVRDGSNVRLIAVQAPDAVGQ